MALRYYFTKALALRFQAACDRCGSAPLCGVSGNSPGEAISKAKKKGFSEWISSGELLCSHCGDTQWVVDEFEGSAEEQEIVKSEIREWIRERNSVGQTGGLIVSSQFAERPALRKMGAERVDATMHGLWLKGYGVEPAQEPDREDVWSVDSFVERK